MFETNICNEEKFNLIVWNLVRLDYELSDKMCKAIGGNLLSLEDNAIELVKNVRTYFYQYYLRK